MYSPLMAEAFRPGRTEREATKKSDVVRLNFSPQVPIASVATVTSRTATRPKAAPLSWRPSCPGPCTSASSWTVHDRSTTRAKARSLRSATRT